MWMLRLKLAAIVTLPLAVTCYILVLPLQPVVLHIGEIKDFNVEAEALRAMSTQLRQYPRAKSVKLVFHLWSARNTAETGYIQFQRPAGFTFHPGSLHDSTLCTTRAFVRENDLHEWAERGSMRSACS
jgi:hypothetical protein